MTPQEFLNPNLHLTFTVKIDCDNKVWRRNAAHNADGAADVLQNDLADAIREAVEGILQRELGEESTTFADYTCQVVDDDKTPIYAYNWNDMRQDPREPEYPASAWPRECTPIRNGEELPYKLKSWYALEREAVTSGDADRCHPEEGHDEWRIEDEHGNEIDSGEGSEEDCQRRFEEIM